MSLAQVYPSRCSHRADPTRVQPVTTTRVMNKIEMNHLSVI